MKVKYISGLCLLLSLFFAACSSSDDDDDTGGGNGDLVLSVDRNVLMNDGQEKATFKVMDGTKEVTYACRIKNKKTGQLVNGGVFSSTTNGEYFFVAEWSGKTSNEVKVTVSGAVAFIKKGLFVQSTSVGCSLCPGMTNIIKSTILPKYPERVEVIAIHSFIMGADPMAVHEYADAWEGHFTIGGLPAAVLDYYQKWMAYSELSIVDNVFSQNRSVLGIGITTQLEGQELTLDFKVRASETPENPCKYVVVLTEDGIEANQEGKGMTEHEWVARKYLTNMLGDYVADNVIRKDNEYTKSLTYTLNTGWNAGKMRAIVILLDAKSGKMINCQGVPLGQSVDYQYLN